MGLGGRGAVEARAMRAAAWIPVAAAVASKEGRNEGCGDADRVAETGGELIHAGAAVVDRAVPEAEESESATAVYMLELYADNRIIRKLSHLQFQLHTGR